MAAFIGEWRGSGWIITPDRTRETFDVYERIEAAAGGQAVFIRGEGFSPEGSGREGEPIHNAAAMIFHDGESHKIRSVLSTGQTQISEIVFEDGRFDWSIALGPQGHVRYSSKIENGAWTETGAYCPPEGECVPTFFMRLEKEN